MSVQASNRLRVLRAERRWPQMKVASKIRMGLNRYWKIENGHTVPEPDEREKIAKAFGVPVEQAFPQEAA